MLKGERFTNTMLKAARNAQLRNQLRAFGSRAVYCALIELQERRHYSPKFALACFRDLFAAWPSWKDKGPPAVLPDMLLEEWLATRKRKAKRVAKPAPLVDLAESVEPQSELMTAADWEAGL
jgi:hypothetical protein